MDVATSWLTSLSEDSDVIPVVVTSSLALDLTTFQVGSLVGLKLSMLE